MIHRIKQFWSGITARIYEEDSLFVRTYLNKEEENLFWQMNISTQRHSLNVAYRALKNAENYLDVDTETLVKGALLHDVGKCQFGSVWWKSFVVLMKKIFPTFTQRIVYSKDNIKWKIFSMFTKICNKT